MKKIACLRYSIIGFIAIIILGNISNLYLTFNQMIEINYLSFTTTFFLNSLFIIGLYIIQKIVSRFKRHDFFNDNNINQMKISGNIFILFSLLSMLNTFFYSQSADLMITNLICYILIIVIGLGLYSFSEVIKKGKKINQENELTI